MKKVLIPDEYVPDYSLPRDEERKRYEEHSEKADKAWADLEEITGEPERAD